MDTIIARTQEKKKLKAFLSSKEAGFLAIYGRRRVGKTYLIRNFFKNQDCYFELVGQKDADLATQLEHFHAAINTAFQPDLPIKKPESWPEALSILTLLIQKTKAKHTILFFDELPWLATRRSGLVEALDYEWNSQWSKLDQVKVVVCGSAASWMLDKLIHAKGGLYNRITDVIQLKPFTLGETALYLKSREIRLNEMLLLELFMVMGGIPFYLNQIKKGQSAAQTIGNVCFDESGLLFSEFNKLFASLFDDSQEHYIIIRAIVGSGNTISRKELLKKTGLSSGGGFKKKMNELTRSGFVREFVPYGKKSREMFYKVIDEYTLFFLQWIEPIQYKSPMGLSNYWQNIVKQSAYHTWCGYAFEAVCLKHIERILEALDIDALSGEIGSWRYIPPRGSREQGAQIDLVVDRADGSITLCEIKYASEPYTINKSYAKVLDRKLEVFKEVTKTRKNLFLTMITTQGLKPNMYAEDLVDGEVVLSDLINQ